MNLIQFFFATFFSGFALIYLKKSTVVTKILMRFFRDLSRFKARRRLFGNRYALAPMLLGKDEFIEIDEKIPLTPDGGEFTMTLEELAEMNGKDENTPIYMAVEGMIYDVTSNREKYGPGRDYHAFAGQEITNALATGCCLKECLHRLPIGHILDENQQKELKRWREFYQLHDRYQCIGRLALDRVEEILENDAAVTAREAERAGREASHPSDDDEIAEVVTDKDNSLFEDTPGIEITYVEEEEK